VPIFSTSGTFPNCRTDDLELNYRSTPQILRACQNLIQHNIRKIDKELGPTTQMGRR
jgi:DNA helicase-2/ATP-dependent DNA helicase PcrA